LGPILTDGDKATQVALILGTFALTSLLNLRLLIVGLIPFVWLRNITLKPTYPIITLKPTNPIITIKPTNPIITLKPTNPIITIKPTNPIIP